MHSETHESPARDAVYLRGAATSMTVKEIEKQLRMGLSASREADDALMRDAADIINALTTPSPSSEYARLARDLENVGQQLTPGAIDRADLDGMYYTVAEAMRLIRSLPAPSKSEYANGFKDGLAYASALVGSPYPRDVAVDLEDAIRALSDRSPKTMDRLSQSEREDRS